jgi:hypothetical protein
MDITKRATSMNTSNTSRRRLIKKALAGVAVALAVASMLASPAEAARYRVRGWRGYGYGARYRTAFVRPRVYGYYGRGAGVYGPRFYNRGYYGAPFGGGINMRGVPMGPTLGGYGTMTPPML